VKAAHERISEGHNVIHVNVKAVASQLRRFVVYLQTILIDVPFRRRSSFHGSPSRVAFSDSGRIAPLPFAYCLYLAGWVSRISFSFIFANAFARFRVSFRVVAQSAFSYLAVSRQAYGTIGRAHEAGRDMAIFTGPARLVMCEAGGARSRANRAGMLLTFGECHV